MNPVDEELQAEELQALEAEISLPAAALYVNVDVNDLLEEYEESKVFEILGQLKDLFAG